MEHYYFLFLNKYFTRMFIVHIQRLSSLNMPEVGYLPGSEMSGNERVMRGKRQEVLVINCLRLSTNMRMQVT